MSLNQVFAATPKPVVAECEGCGEQEGGFCKRYSDPGALWALGSCPMHSGLLAQARERAAAKQVGRKVNPIKASKRAAGKK
ncbi:MAG: PxxKW family cysteine-rich protein [Candidatus Niyogibacteria bacterium]|nr:MAG: PxxKW family cysteine-rich protein [Candidatus Niyogibacteria bacterium]